MPPSLPGTLAFVMAHIRKLQQSISVLLGSSCIDTPPHTQHSHRVEVEPPLVVSVFSFPPPVRQVVENKVIFRDWD